MELLSGTQYTDFASVYDMFMDNVPYDEWAEYLHRLLRENGVEKGIIAELGCGTGRITRKLRDFGYDMIGIDISKEMLQIAAEKEREGVAGEILYLNQDMREFELFGTVAAVVSICDSMNYITEKEDLLQIFKLVENYLDPGGVFIFDMNTPYYYKKVLGETTICDNREEGSLIWENYYDPESGINEFDITIYIGRKTKKKNTSGTGDKEKAEVYERFEETHYQRAYKPNMIKKLLEKAGLVNVKMYKAFTGEIPDSKTERIYFIASKKQLSI
ncbi:MAG: class I SAM-dependent methyltransferase [Lachnospiraceae bacterium]|nr:class I SAM-dependent methyltransferase [Lachnospiraceae bacterium]